MALTVIQETNQFPLHSGWIFQTCLVRTPAGKLEYWDMPLRPLETTR